MLTNVQRITVALNVRISLLQTMKKVRKVKKMIDYSKKAIAIVRKWSDEHPPETQKSEENNG